MISQVVLFLAALTFNSVVGQDFGRECTDLDKNCEHWDKFCKENDWVQETCKQTCRLCPETKFQPSTSELVNFKERPCEDSDNNCRSWISQSPGLCASTDYIRKNCQRACNLCKGGGIPEKYDIQNLPEELKPMAFLLGRWRSEHGGKARFPTIPVFTYGEQLDFSISSRSLLGPKALNYSGFAWGINNKDELHSEYGFLAIKPSSNQVALTTVMNNGFTTVEEGEAAGNRVKLRLQDIGRITFSRDLPVHDLTREWVMIDTNTLEQSLEMETLTHPMQQHTFIRYKKIYP